MKDKFNELNKFGKESVDNNELYQKTIQQYREKLEQYEERFLQMQDQAQKQREDIYNLREDKFSLIEKYGAIQGQMKKAEEQLKMT